MAAGEGVEEEFGGSWSKIRGWGWSDVLIKCCLSLRERMLFRGAKGNCEYTASRATAMLELLDLDRQIPKEL